MLMQKVVFFALLALAVLVPLHGSMAIAPKMQPKVLILSSIEKQYPMQYMVEITNDLKQAGYNVTFLKDEAVTVNFVTTQLDKYDVLIWRTGMYVHGNTTYWYLGEAGNQTTVAAYARSISIGTLDASTGVLGVSANFFSNNYGPKSLANIKLAILISSMSITIAQIFVNAGVKTTIDFYQTLTAPLSLFDWVTRSLVGYLTTGSTVRDSIAKTIYNYEYVSSLDDSYLPPISFLGDGNLQIA
jgi:DNA-dependent RNA polymerase auxiliary subunit epsilon